MAGKLYVKPGTLSSDERKMVRALEKFVKAKTKEDASFSLTPARNLAELKQYFVKYCTTPAEIVSETINPKPSTKQEPEIQDQTEAAIEKETKQKQPQTPEHMAETTEKKEFIDPMLRSNPKIRDYVTDDTFQRPEEKEAKKQDTTGEIPEPKSFDDAFGIKDPNKASSGPGSFPGADSKKDKPKPKEYEPINPDFEDMAKSKKNKQTRRFAKYIVEATAALMEKGCIWWTTKDINDIKMAEYEIEGTVNLEVLFSMDGETMMTVREFFKMKCREAETIYAWTPEEKGELAEALYDVMLERGLAPTPMQTLIMVFLGISLKKVGVALVNGMQINAILNHPQIRVEAPEQHAPLEAEGPKPTDKQKPDTHMEVVPDSQDKVDPEKVMAGEQKVAADPTPIKKTRKSRKAQVVAG